MSALDDAAVSCGVSATELSLWIERRWILPLRQNSDYIFAEADLARAGMIAELRRDLGIDDEAMPVVLGLLDQIYGMRRRVRQLISALDALPDTQREAILQALDGDTLHRR